MSVELTVLALVGLLQGFQFLIYAIAANRELGPRVTMGPRDVVISLGISTGRLQRALNNHFEGLIMFTLAVVVVVLGGQSSGVTVFCAWLYLAMRVLYIPAYVLGWVPWRSVIWATGFGATMLMILAALL